MFFDAADAPALYARLRQSLVPQLLRLSTDQADTPVAACPGWAVRDVMAHVSGLVAETLAGVPLPRGSDEATARQVRDRAHLSLSQICDEWLANADAFAAFGQDDPAYVAALTSDLVVHGGDIDEALDAAVEVDEHAVQLVAARYGLALTERAEAANCPVTLVLRGEQLGSDATPESVVLRSSAHDFLRAVTGRRTGTQVRAMDWTGDPEPLLAAAWSQYGPLVD